MMSVERTGTGTADLNGFCHVSLFVPVVVVVVIVLFCLPIAYLSIQSTTCMFVHLALFRFMRLSLPACLPVSISVSVSVSV